MGAKVLKSRRIVTVIHEYMHASSDHDASVCVSEVNITP